MAETDDDPVASWRDRLGTLRKRGRISAGALAVVPAEEIDVRRGRPPAPERLNEAGRALWEHLTFSRRSGWFAGAETLLESFVVTSIQIEQIETALRTTPITDAGYSKLARTPTIGCPCGHVGHAVAPHAAFARPQDAADRRRSAGGLRVLLQL